MQSLTKRRKTAEEVRAHGVECLTFDLDVTKLQSVIDFHAAMVAKLEKFDDKL